MTRIIGNIEAKMFMGGVHSQVIAEPEIREYKLKGDIDFILLGSEKVNSRECLRRSWSEGSF